MHTQVKAGSQQNAIVITSEHSCIIKLQRKSNKSELAWWSLAAKHRRFELIPELAKIGILMETAAHSKGRAFLVSPE